MNDIETDEEIMESLRVSKAAEEAKKPEPVPTKIKQLPQPAPTINTKPAPPEVPRVKRPEFLCFVRLWRMDNQETGVIGQLKSDDGKLIIDANDGKPALAVIKSFVGLDGKVRHETSDNKVWKTS